MKNAYGAAVLAALCIVISASSAQAAETGVLEFDSGANPGSTGAYSYDVTLSVPSGTAGLTPTVRLDYSSNGAWGIAGRGWELQRDCIQRRGPTPYSPFAAHPIEAAGAPGFFEETGVDEYYWNGQRLEYCNNLNAGPYGDGSETSSCEPGLPVGVSHLRTAYNDGAARVEAHWVGIKVDTFTITLKDGTVLRYGETINGSPSKFSLFPDAFPHMWCLSSVTPLGEPAGGNRMEVEYDQTLPGYPASIEYGLQDDGTFPAHRVEFKWEGRPDSREIELGGRPHSFDKRLNEVRTYSLDRVVNVYNLVYVNQCTGAPCPPLPFSGTSLLWKIDRYGEFDEGLGSPHETLYEFEYQDSSVSSVFSPTDQQIPVFPATLPRPTFSKWRVVDFNGDGTLDLKRYSNLPGLDPEQLYHMIDGGAHYLRWDSEVGVEHKVDPFLYDALPHGITWLEHMYMTGSNFPDLVAHLALSGGGEDWRMYAVDPDPANGTSNGLTYAEAGNIGDLNPADPTVVAIDLDGDGKTDLTNTQGSSLGGGGPVLDFWTFPVGKIQNTFPPTLGGHVVDLNGDGLQDFIQSYRIIRSPTCRFGHPAWDEQHRAYINRGAVDRWSGAKTFEISAPPFDGVPGTVVTVAYDGEVCRTSINDMVSFADLTGDGLPEFVRSIRDPGPPSLTRKVYRNNGHWAYGSAGPSWGFDTTRLTVAETNLPALQYCRNTVMEGMTVCDPDDVEDAQVHKLIDVNGDGLLDAISSPNYNDGGFNQLTFRTSFDEVGPSFERLVSVRNAVGGVQRIGYRAVQNDSNETNRIPLAKVVVDSITHCPGGESGCGSNPDDIVEHFDYESPIYSTVHRGVIGFAKTKSWKGGGDTEPPGYVQMTETGYFNSLLPYHDNTCYAGLPQWTVESSTAASTAQGCSHEVIWEAGQPEVESSGCSANSVASAKFHGYEPFVPTTAMEAGNCNPDLPKRPILARSTISRTFDPVMGLQLSAQRVSEYDEEDAKLSRITRSCTYGDAAVDFSRTTCTAGHSEMERYDYLDFTDATPPWVKGTLCRTWIHGASPTTPLGHEVLTFTPPGTPGAQCLISVPAENPRLLPLRSVVKDRDGNPATRTDYAYDDNGKLARQTSYSHHNATASQWEKPLATFYEYYLGELPRRSCTVAGVIPADIDACWALPAAVTNGPVEYQDGDNPLLPTSVADYLGNTAYTWYDELWRPWLERRISVQGKLLGETTKSWLNWGDPALQYVETTSLVGSSEYQTSLNYIDGFGRTVQTVLGPYTAQPLVTSSTYNDLGQLKTTSTPTADVEFVYDRWGRRSKERQNGLLATRWLTAMETAPDGEMMVGTTRQRVQPNSVVRRTEKALRDSLGRMRFSFWDTSGEYVEYQYDEAGRLARSYLPSPDGIAPRPLTEFSYDAKGRLDGVAEPNRSNCGTPWDCPWTTSYDTSGNILLQTDAKGSKRRTILDSWRRPIWRIACKSDGPGAWTTEDIGWFKYYDRSIYTTQPHELHIELHFNPQTIDHTALRDAMESVCSLPQFDDPNQETSLVAWLDALETSALGQPPDSNKKWLKPYAQTTRTYHYNEAGNPYVSSVEHRVPQDVTQPLNGSYARHETFSVVQQRINGLSGALDNYQVSVNALDGTSWTNLETDTVTLDYDDHGRVRSSTSANHGPILSNRLFTAQGLPLQEDLGAALGQPGHVARLSYTHELATGSEFRGLLKSKRYNMASGSSYALDTYAYWSGTKQLKSYRSSFLTGATDPIQKVFTVHSKFDYDAIGELTHHKQGAALNQAQYAEGNFAYDVLGNRILGSTWEVVRLSPLMDPGAPGSVPGPGEGEGPPVPGGPASGMGPQTPILGANQVVDANGNIVEYTTEQSHDIELDYNTRMQLVGQKVIVLGVPVADLRILRDASGAKVATYSNGDLMTYGPSSRVRVLGGTSTAEAQLLYADGAETRFDDGSLQFLLRDHLGSVVAQADTSGVTHLRGYLPFGGVFFDTLDETPLPDVSDTSFTGKREEGSPSTGDLLMDFHARHMPVNAGAFSSVDTVVPNSRWPVGLHPYAYAFNDPVNLVDPDGHAPAGWPPKTEPPCVGCYVSENSEARTTPGQRREATREMEKARRDEWKEYKQSWWRTRLEELVKLSPQPTQKAGQPPLSMQPVVTADATPIATAIGPDGSEGPEGYASADAAAKAVLTEWNEKSMVDNIEYGGFIYEIDGVFYYTRPEPGDDTSLDLTMPLYSMVPSGANVVGDYHTHSDYSDQNRVRTTPDLDYWGSDFFSPYIRGYGGDLNRTSGALWRCRPSYVSYLGTPSGQFHAWDPHSNRFYRLQ